MRDNKRILIVDDDIALTRLMRMNLEETGRYVIMEENRAQSALKTALTFMPDLILLDVMMPGMDGGDVAAQLRSLSTFRDIPIVFLTAAAKRSEIEDHHGHIGGLPFLAKPVDLDELLACLDEHLSPARPPSTDADDPNQPTIPVMSK